MSPFEDTKCIETGHQNGTHCLTIGHVKSLTPLGIVVGPERYTSNRYLVNGTISAISLAVRPVSWSHNIMNYYRLGILTVSGINVSSKRIYTEAEKNEIESTWTFRNSKGALYFELVKTEDKGDKK